MRPKINQRLIDSLKPSPTGNQVIWDDQVRGFGVRVSVGGAKSYFLNYRIHGRERRYTIARCDEWTLTRARARAEKLRGQINDGIDPLEEKRKKRQEIELEGAVPSFADLAAAYLDSASAYNREHTLREDQRMLSAILLPQFGTHKVTDITSEDLGKLHRSLKATPYQANRVLALVSVMFRFAIEVKRWRLDNPAKHVERFQEDKREYWLTLEQLDRVLDALSNHPNQKGATAVRLLILTGARKAEVLSATWPQLDLERGIWTKPSHHTKQKKIEYVPLSAAALDLLRGMEPQGEYLFPGKFGDHLTDVKNIWEDVRREAGIPECRIHDLRHSFASHLVSKGESLHVIGRLLGHTQPGTTARYSHVADEALRNATNRFAEILKGNLPKKPSTIRVT